MIVYEGVSQIDLKTEIVAILTGYKRKSKNTKTGSMLQLWILVKDQNPIAASKEGADSAICGNCPHRWATGGACYVNLGQAPLQVWKSYNKGNHGPLDETKLKGRKIRLGAYGDPAALPIHVVSNLIYKSGQKQWTGYTHQWRNCDPRLRFFCQASVDSEQEALEAQGLGWKTFRIKNGDEPNMSNEIDCLNTSRGLTCEACTICRGGKGNIVIDVHGSRKGNFKAKEMGA